MDHYRSGGGGPPPATDRVVHLFPQRRAQVPKRVTQARSRNGGVVGQADRLCPQAQRFRGVHALLVPACTYRRPGAQSSVDSGSRYMRLSAAFGSRAVILGSS